MAEIPEVITLANLRGGVALELWQAEWDGKVLPNILDANTEAEAVRTITLQFRIKPNAKRDTLDIEIGCTSRTAQLARVETLAYVGKHRGQPVAFESNPKQLPLDMTEEQQQQAAAKSAQKGAVQ